MKNEKPTVGLYMIVKDEFDLVLKLIQASVIAAAFNSIYLTVSDKKTYKRFKELEKAEGFHVDYREWNGRFDEARNHNFAQGDTDLAFWLDADDKFDFSVIPELVKLNVDAVWLPYEYAYDEDGNCIALHWRERLVKKDKFTWRGWVHETLISEEQVTSERVNAPVRHTGARPKESMERNHKILEQAYKETKDPRYIHYLGISYYSLEQWQNCIDILKEYVSVGGWDEEIYRSLLRMSEASNNLGRVEEALQFALRAAALLPEYPSAYFNLAQFEFEKDNFKECLEWLKVAFSKPEPQSASITDPTVPDRARLMGAIAEHKQGNNREAAKLLGTVQTIDVSSLLVEIKKEASIDNAAAILPALFKHYENPSYLWENLKDNLKYDNRFRKVREAVTEPKTWPKNSIVFFCGRGYEEWGPHTLDKGMGGSEEAVVYLSYKLAELGYDVTIYGELEKPIKEGHHLKWLPWTHIDKRDTFDTLIIWRYPQFVPQFKANKMFVDMHDMLPPNIVKPYKNATYLFKSEAHAKKYPQLSNYNVISNGISLEQFDKKVKRDPHKLVWTSGYYRGLECLVDLWPRIKQEVPEATLDVYYGWESWIAAEGENNFYHRMSNMLAAAKKDGVQEHGRVSHEELAKKMLGATVWAYPTQFEETNCITALKANAAGLKPVITDVAALAETGGPIATYIESARIYSDDYAKDKFVKSVVKALKTPLTKEELAKQKEWVEQYTWENIAKQWKGAIDG